MTRMIDNVSSPSNAATSTAASRFLVAIVMSISLAACTGSPTKPDAASTTPMAKSETSMTAAAGMYNDGNYVAALEAFDGISTDSAASANDRRLAHLGKALVYLGSDPKLHSVANAKISLVSASQVKAGANEGFLIETDMLMEAVSFVIGTESKFDVMKEKSGGSNFQVSQLKKENTALQIERDELLAEQQVLKDALEKLKKLTLSN